MHERDFDTESLGFSKHLANEIGLSCEHGGGIGDKFCWAFSDKVRRQIWERAGGRSEISGDTEHLMCSHINHDKRNPDYNNPDNGVLATKREEYLLHYYNEGQNGLSIRNNRTTLWGLWNELSWKERQGLPEPPDF